MRSDADRLADMLAAAVKIRERIPAEFESFSQEELLQVWVIHHLQTIGEAARQLAASLADRYPEVPWSQIVGLRNILVHEYFGLNLHQVWVTAVKEVPVLEAQIRRILSEWKS